VPWRRARDFAAALKFIEKEVKADEAAEKAGKLNPDDKLRLVVFDVVTSFKKATAADVRESLQPLTDYCEAHSISVIFVLHLLHKGSSEKSLLRMISGSQSWVQVCSTILAVGMMEVNFGVMKTQEIPTGDPWFEGVPRLGVFEVTHSNLVRANSRWYYKWEGKAVPPLKGPVSAVSMGNVSQMSVQMVLRMNDERDSRAANKSPRDEAKNFLVKWLLEAANRDIPQPVLDKAAQEDVRVKAARMSSDLEAARLAEGIKEHTLARARKDMEVMNLLYAWQINRKWWTVLPDVAGIVLGDEGDGGNREGGDREGNGFDHESNFGDQGQSVH
jgi:hypothetical protein